MAQYILSQGISELEHALSSYEPLSLKLTPFSLGHRKGMGGGRCCRKMNFNL